MCTYTHTIFKEEEVKKLKSGREVVEMDGESIMWNGAKSTHI